MRVRKLVAGLSVVTAVLGSLAANASADSRVDRGAVQQAMAELVAAGATGVQVRIVDQGGTWTGSAGVAERDRPEGVSPQGRFRVGSITKTFVATVVLQLVAEGRVGLDDPVSRYLPQFGLDPRITVRMILQHTSGLGTHTGDILPDGSIEPGYVDSPYRSYNPDELVRFVVAKPLKFEPGTQWAYSNTDYVLAGLLIEKLTGTPYALQVYLRIGVPLGLWQTELPGTSMEILGPHAHGYVIDPSQDPPALVDITRQNPSMVGASGEIISTTQDLDTFLAALLGGRLLPPAQLAVMRELYPLGPNSGYGLGLIGAELQPGCVGVGHDGRMPGYTSNMYGTVDGRARVTISVTEGTADPLSMEFALPVAKLLQTSLCGAADPGMTAARAQWVTEVAR